MTPSSSLTLAGSSSAGILGLWICGDILTLLVKMKGLNTERCGSGVPVNQWQLGLWVPWLITDTWPRETDVNLNVKVEMKGRWERGRERKKSDRKRQRHPWYNIPTNIISHRNSFIIFIISFTLNLVKKLKPEINMLWWEETGISSDTSQRAYHASSCGALVVHTAANSWFLVPQNIKHVGQGKVTCQQRKCTSTDGKGWEGHSEDVWGFWCHLHWKTCSQRLRKLTLQIFHTVK